MKKILSMIIGLVVLAGLAYGLAVVILHWRAERMVNELVLQASDYAEVGYHGLDVDLSGVLVVKNVTVTPHGAGKPLRAQRVIFTGPNAGFYLFNGDWEPGDEPPARLGLSIEGIEARVEDLKINPVSPEGVSLLASNGCSIGQGPSPEVMSEMGMESVVIDMAMGYDYNESKRRFDAYFNLDIQDVESIESSLVLNDVVLNSFELVPGREPSLVRAEMDMRVEPAFAERFLRTCAKREGQSLAEYRTRQLRAFHEELAAVGMRLGPGLVAALEQFYTEWGNVKIALYPDEPLGLLQLAFTPPPEMPRVLGLELSVNDTRVHDLSLFFEGMHAGFNMLKEDDEPQGTYTPRVHYQYRYLDISKNQLPQHLRNHVRLHVVGQPVREGLLVSVSQDMAGVEQRHHGGKLTAHVKLEDVERIEVRVVEAQEGSASN